MTVIVLTTGTSWTVPSDFTVTNTVETWGASAGGNSHNFITGGPVGGGGGAYSSITGISLTIGAGVTISIGVGGVGETRTVNSTAGTDTWFNGATLAASSVGAKGGARRSGNVAGSLTGGVGGLASAGVGTTKFNGGNGGSCTAGIAAGGGGGGAGSASGAGGNGGTGAAPLANGGAGGASDSAGGLGGDSTTLNGQAGTADSLGGSGGGGGYSGDNATTASANGGNGGLPGGGGGGGGSNVLTGSTGGNGAGGQITVTYTPAQGGISEQWADQLWSMWTQKYLRLYTKYRNEYDGWFDYQMPADNITAFNGPVDVPRGKFWDKRHSFQGQQSSPLSANNVIAVTITSNESPRGRYWDRRHSYEGMQRAPLADSVQPPLASSRMFDNPPETRLSRMRKQTWLYQGVMNVPPPLPFIPPPQRTFLPLIGVGY